MPPADSAEPLPPALRPRDARPQRERITSYAEKRMSAYSHRTSTRSRPQSNVFPAFHSSLTYALVRDFAYPAFHPMHYGAPPEAPSGSTTPGSEWQGSRRSSDPMEGVGRGGWSAGPWGGDGVLFGDTDQQVDPLPSTSFGDEYRDELHVGQSKRKHRKSKSYANIADLDRGRRRESGHHRRSRQIEDLFQNQDGSTRRDSPFHTSRLVNPDSDMPLDSEIPTSPSHSPGAYRRSIGPDDEDLYAGESLALYSFEPENANELRLTEGQHILVAYRHGQGWLVAEDKETGEQGLVPEAYVRLIADIPNYDPVEKRFLPIDDLEEETEALDLRDEVSEDNSKTSQMSRTVEGDNSLR